MNEERLGFVGLVIDDRAAAPQVNRILGDYGHMIRGRMGVPDPEREEAVICLIVRGSNDELGAMTGKLGSLPGVRVKSGLTESKFTLEKKKG